MFCKKSLIQARLSWPPKVDLKTRFNLKLNLKVVHVILTNSIQAFKNLKYKKYIIIYKTWRLTKAVKK